MPSEAQIQIINNDNIDIIASNKYQSVTPSYIREIQPGVYTLKLSKRNYKEIVRKITVYGAMDENKGIFISQAKVVNGVHVIPFDVDLEFNSVPTGAVLYIDDVKISETPIKVTLEIGKKNIKLIKDGYDMYFTNRNSNLRKKSLLFKLLKLK